MRMGAMPMRCTRHLRTNGPLARVASALLLLALTSACVSKPDRSAATTFVVVRHAEKATDDPRDPALSEAGRARAEALAALMRREPLVAVYATPYRRAQLTAAPAARDARIGVGTYDAALPAAVFAQQLIDTRRPGTVLVVGHSNTAPDIAAALCACKVAPMTDDTFNVIHRIDVRPGTPAVLRSSTY